MSYYASTIAAKFSMNIQDAPKALSALKEAALLMPDKESNVHYDSEIWKKVKCSYDFLQIMDYLGFKISVRNPRILQQKV